AIIALSDFSSQRAVEIALDVLERPMDYYLEYALAETIATLEPYWKPVLAAGNPFATSNPAAADYLLAKVSTAELVKMAPSVPVFLALLSREGVLHEHRHDALMALAELNKTDEMTELLAAIDRSDQRKGIQAGSALGDLGHMLVEHAACELGEHRANLEQMANKARQATTRQVAYAALITADNSIEKVWNATPKSADALGDLLDGVVLLPNPKLRGAFFPKITDLLRAGLSAQIFRAAVGALAYVDGHEAESFKLLADFIRDGREREECIRAIRRIPKSKWIA